MRKLGAVPTLVPLVAIAVGEVLSEFGHHTADKRAGAVKVIHAATLFRVAPTTTSLRIEINMTQCSLDWHKFDE